MLVDIFESGLRYQVPGQMLAKIFHVIVDASTHRMLMSLLRKFRIFVELTSFCIF